MVLKPCRRSCTAPRLSFCSASRLPFIVVFSVISVGKGGRVFNRLETSGGEGQGLNWVNGRLRIHISKLEREIIVLYAHELWVLIDQSNDPLRDKLLSISSSVECMAADAIFFFHKIGTNGCHVFMTHVKIRRLLDSSLFVFVTCRTKAPLSESSKMSSIDVIGL
jgi:hypothetical protein